MLKLLGADKVDPGELSQILLQHFNRASHVSENEVVFAPDLAQESVR